MKYDKVVRRGKTYFRYRHWDTVLKKHVKTIYALKYKELKEKVDDYVKMENAGVVETHELFVDFCEDWLYHVHLVDKKPSTKARYDTTFNCHIKNSRVGKIKLPALTTSDLQKWYNQVFDKSGENVVKNLHKVVRPCIRYAYQNGFIVRNIGEMVKVPKDLGAKRKKQKINPLSLEDQKKFVKVIEGHQYEALFNTALDTGMREGELFALTWKDIDFENNEINIDKTFSYVKDIETKKRVQLVTDPKTEESIRKLPMAKRTIHVLRKHKFDQMQQLLRIGISQSDETLVFCTPVATFLDSSNVLKKLKAEYEKIGITDKVFHDLRHTYATRLFELGEPAKTIQKLLGHSNVNVTLGTYTHVLDDLKEKAVNKIDDIYSEKPKSEFVGQHLDNIIPFRNKKTP